MSGGNIYYILFLWDHVGKKKLCIGVHGKRAVALLTFRATTYKPQKCSGSSYIKCNNIKKKSKGVVDLRTLSATTE